ncbi:ATP-binding protein [Streptomyces sp. SL13]|uniref:ATP-binding protein n=1 Tax=Streptantibioticus silvisoli TaxID=2705255 RepID=A0AA90H6X4_9ACTN|nr:ATP-binding protein [Streptantibioticus silvisoli]MDI5972068.1 ATP-binding protein [Streptantibioticus silvisoli]
MPTRQPRRCALELEAQPSRAGQVRRIVSAQLRYWNLDPVVDTAILGVTELLANVHRHAEPDKNCTVTLSLDSGLLTVSVADHDPRPALVGLRTDTLDTGGRGLAMIAALCDSWGCRPTEDGTGKAVWFTLLGPVSAVLVDAAVPADPPARDVLPVPAITLDDLAPPVAVSFA